MSETAPTVEPTDGEWLRTLRTRLPEYRGPRDDPRPRPGGTLASVAILLRTTLRATELLLIERAVLARDPWSGHMALPGGRMEPGDGSLFATAVRETLEETGIDVARVGDPLGRLDLVEPLSPRVPVLSVLPFVFRVPADATPGPPNTEVARALWVPVAHFDDPAARTVHRVRTGDVIRRFPGVTVEGGVVWGLTHRILTDLLARLPRTVPDERGPSPDG